MMMMMLKKKMMMINKKMTILKVSGPSSFAPHLQ